MTTSIESFSTCSLSSHSDILSFSPHSLLPLSADHFQLKNKAHNNEYSNHADLEVLANLVGVAITSLGNDQVNVAAARQSQPWEGSGGNNSTTTNLCGRNRFVLKDPYTSTVEFSQHDWAAKRTLSTISCRNLRLSSAAESLRATKAAISL